MSIYVQHDGETYGPFSREEVVAHLQDGVLSEDDLACTDENLEGIPLKHLLDEQSADASLPDENEANEIPVIEDPDHQSYEQEQLPDETQEPAAPSEVPSLLDLQLRRESARQHQPQEEEPAKSGKVFAFSMAAAAVFLASAAAAFFVFKPAHPNVPIAAATPPRLPVSPKPQAASPTNQEAPKPGISQNAQSTPGVLPAGPVNGTVPPSGCCFSG